MLSRRAAVFVVLPLLAAGLLLGWIWQTSSQPVTLQDDAYATAPHGGDAILPLPPVPELPVDKVALGKRLFFEKRLSHDDSLSCATCHDFQRGGADGRATGVGIGGKQGTVNTPTVFNASLSFVQFWDGRAATLEEQAAGPVHNPIEMASNWDEVISKLSSDSEYALAFQKLYNGITGEAIVDAIATFERTLITGNSRFDRFLRGDRSALNATEQRGYQHFLDYGCASCHQGAQIGGNMYQRFGVMGEYFQPRPGDAVVKSDLGRFNVTGREEDRHVFKVPSLRNVAVTAPYFHNGEAATLEEAVVTMGRYQLGRQLSGQDLQSIVAFLRTLTGEWEGKPLQ